MTNPELKASAQRLSRRILASFDPNGVRPVEITWSGLGDEAGRLKVETGLSAHWRSTGKEQILACGTDLIYHLSPAGFGYYLPAFLVFFLNSEDFGWFEEILIPAGPGYEDVAEHFSGGAMCPPFGASAERSFRRALEVRSKLSMSQRECVASYIEIAETYPRELSSRPNVLLEKYMGFWLEP